MWPHLTTTSVALRWESRHWWLRTWATVTVWITRVSSAVETWCRAGVVSDTSDCILCLYDWLTKVCVNLFCALSLDLIRHRRSITIAICLCLQLKERGKHWVVYREFIFRLSELPTLFHGEDNIYCWVLNTQEWSLSSYHLVMIQACISMLRNWINTCIWMPSNWTQTLQFYNNSHQITWRPVMQTNLVQKESLCYCL